MRWRARQSGSPRWKRSRSETEGLVATVGKMTSNRTRQCDPGAGAVSLDVRHATMRRAKPPSKNSAAKRKAIAEKRGSRSMRHRQMDQPAVPMDERLTAFLADAIEAAGFPEKPCPAAPATTPW
jgi:allantoate deiminase